MQIYLGRSLPQSLPPCAVTIGNFDGVHLGHRRILQRLSEQARLRGLLSAVVIFEPQPQEFFARQRHASMPYRLTPLRQKLQLLADSGFVDMVWVVRFGVDFAGISAQDFIDKILINRLNTQYLLVGDDFCFGQGRAGNFDLLSKQTAFVTEQTPTIMQDGFRISSTLIRKYLFSGCLKEAAILMGRNYALCGRVKHGAKLGRTLGCPTANIHLPMHHYPLSGVFVVLAECSFGLYQGVASMGLNPTVSQTADTKLEVHLFDFSDNLYGERLRVHFLHKLRDEHKFLNLAQLQQQIATDMDDARNWFATNRTRLTETVFQAA